MTDDFTLKWDAQNEQLFGEDPATGNKIPIPFESVNAKETFTGPDAEWHQYVDEDGDLVTEFVGE